MTNDKPMLISSRQIRIFDEIRSDEQAAERTLKTALNYHHNVINEIEKRKREIWRELADIHGLDIYRKIYKTTCIDGISQVVEKNDDNVGDAKKT